MTADIIQFPGCVPKQVGLDEAAGELPAVPAKPDPAHPQEVTLLLNAKQQKAVQIIASGMAFVVVGIKPDEGGARFFTSLHGDHTDLRNAEDHLPAVIGRLYQREGVR